MNHHDEVVLHVSPIRSSSACEQVQHSELYTSSMEVSTWITASFTCEIIITMWTCVFVGEALTFTVHSEHLDEFCKLLHKLKFWEMSGTNRRCKQQLLGFNKQH